MIMRSEVSITRRQHRGNTQAALRQSAGRACSTGLLGNWQLQIAHVNSAAPAVIHGMLYYLYALSIRSLVALLEARECAMLLILVAFSTRAHTGHSAQTSLSRLQLHFALPLASFSQLIHVTSCTS